MANRVRVTDARYRALKDADARRSQLGFTYATVAEQGLLPVRSVGSYLRGERWPNGAQRAKLEHAIGWPAGELDRRAGRYARTPERGMRWVTDRLYRYRVANMILKAGVRPEDRPGGVAPIYVEGTIDADPAVPFDLVEAILEGAGIDISQLDNGD